MRIRLRRRFALAAVVVPLACVAAANPPWASAAGLDVWNLPRYERQLAASDAAADRLDRVDELILHRIATKEALVAELIAGRLTLAETADQFRALNDASPFAGEYVRATFEGESDGERTARNVIDYTLRRVNDPAERDALLCRLHAELADIAGVVGH